MTAVTAGLCFSIPTQPCTSPRQSPSQWEGGAGSPASPCSRLEVRARRLHPATLHQSLHVSKMPQGTDSYWTPIWEALVWGTSSSSAVKKQANASVQSPFAIWQFSLFSKCFAVSCRVPGGVRHRAGWGAACIVLRIRNKMIKVLCKPKDVG